MDLKAVISLVSARVGHLWKFLARALDFTETDIASIETGNPFNLMEQIFQVFHRWKRREGREATTARLLSALKNAGVGELAEMSKEITGELGITIEGKHGFCSSIVS